jgi:hypothetical protein
VSEFFTIATAPIAQVFESLKAYNLARILLGFVCHVLRSFGGQAVKQRMRVMLKPMSGAVALLALLAAAPAAATINLTFSYLGAPNQTPSAVTRTTNGVTVTANAKRFGFAPAALTNISQLTAGTLRTTASGLGVNGGLVNASLDTELNSREAVLLTGSRTLRLSGMLLNLVNNTDTLQVFGVNADTGNLESLGYGGNIRSGLAGAAGFVNTAANGGTTALTFNSLSPVYTQFLLTTRIDGRTSTTVQDYRIGSLTFAVPEPQTWALMIIGFGMVGVTTRRRKAAVAG